MRMTGIGIAATGLLVLLPASVAAQEERYRGICDASAAIALDADHFVVGEDDDNKLYIFRRGKPDRVKTVDLIDFLDSRKKNGESKQADIEAAAQIGDTIYWITSHGRNSEAEKKKTRRRFFATTIVPKEDGPTVEALTSTPYKKLLKALLAEEKLKPLDLEKAAEKAPKHKDGFNIEGLAETPEGYLLIGFRNPRPEGKAIIVTLRNPKAVIKNGEKPKFGKPKLLDLGNRGIRSMERVGARYLIVAGPFDSGDSGEPGSDFALYGWDGRDTQPSRIEVDLGTLNPEAIFVIPNTNNEVVILSDDGTVQVDGKDCKDDEVPDSKKGFRARTLQLP